MKIEQFVMAYGIEQDRIRALLPDNFLSLRPVLRINAEIRDSEQAYLEFNTPVEYKDKRGWLNIGRWNNVSFEKRNNSTAFYLPALIIRFDRLELEGGCPAEKDNAGTWYLVDHTFQPAEKIVNTKRFCNCEFSWNYEKGAHGKSIGKTLPAYPTKQVNIYAKEKLTVEKAAVIPCEQVLGTYVVQFERG